MHLGALGVRLVHLGALGVRLVHLGALGVRFVHLGALGVRFVHLDALGVRLVHLECFTALGQGEVRPPRKYKWDLYFPIPERTPKPRQDARQDAAPGRSALSRHTPDWRGSAHFFLRIFWTIITEAGFSRELELAFTSERFSEVLEDC